MKILNQIGSYVIADLDFNNFVVYDVRKDSVNKKTGVVAHDYSFHLKLEQAEDRLSRDWAREMTSSTSEQHKARDGVVRVLQGDAEVSSLTIHNNN